MPLLHFCANLFPICFIYAYINLAIAENSVPVLRNEQPQIMQLSIRDNNCEENPANSDGATLHFDPQPVHVLKVGLSII